MKRKILSLLLSLSLCLALLPSALADEAVEFTDVPAGSWFEQGVKTCAERGVMVGTGEGVFSPDAELSQAECLTLAYRLYDLGQGGDGSLLTAPEDWGKLTYTLADGTVFEGYGYQSGVGDSFGWWHWPKNDVRGGYVTVPGCDYETEPETWAEQQRLWMEEHKEACASDAPATLTLNGETYTGTVWCWIPVGSYVLMFQPEHEVFSQVSDLISHAIMREVGPDRWWRNVSYTIHQKELEDVIDPVDFSDHPATRSFFAHALASAAGELEKLFSLETLPDLGREYNEDIYTLYEAGILTGTDEFGTFQPDKTLTRAEAAVMVARVLDESQRVSPPLSYEEMVTQLAAEENYTVEWSSDGGYGTVLLRWKPLSPEDGTRDYELWLVRKDGKAKKLLLPSTVLRPNGDSPTDRAPDSWQDKQDEQTLTYLYCFYEPLTDGDTVYHEAGTYVYTADLTTGEVTAYIDPLSLLNLSYYEAFETLRAEEGYQSERVMDGGSVVVLLRSKVCEQAPELRDYELYLLYKAALPHVYRLALPSTAVLPDGYAPTTQEPEDMRFYGDNGPVSFAYTYRFQEALKDGDTLLHDKGTYVYTVDIATAAQSVKLEDSYEKALADVLYCTEKWQIDQRLETEFCTIVAKHTEGGWSGIYPGASICLIFKDGSPNGAGTVVTLPVLSGTLRYGSFLPDTIELDPTGNILTYSYHYAENQYAHTLNGSSYLAYEAGTYTYTVDLSAGTVTDEYIPLN